MVRRYVGEKWGKIFTFCSNSSAAQFGGTHNVLTRDTPVGVQPLHGQESVYHEDYIPKEQPHASPPKGGLYQVADLKVSAEVFQAMAWSRA